MKSDVEPPSLRTYARLSHNSASIHTMLTELCEAMDMEISNARFGREDKPSGPVWISLREEVGVWRACTHDSTSTTYSVFVTPDSVLVRGYHAGDISCPPDDNVTRDLLTAVDRALRTSSSVNLLGWLRRNEAANPDAVLILESTPH
jgi:hypothetical protein